MGIGGVAKGASAGLEIGADITKSTTKIFSGGIDISKGLTKGLASGLETTADIGQSAAKSVSSLDKLKGLLKIGKGADVGKVGKIAGAVDTVADAGKVGKLGKAAGSVDTVADAGKGAKAAGAVDTAADASKATTKPLDKAAQKTVQEGMETAAKGVTTKAEYLKKFGKKYGKYIVGGLTIATIATVAGVKSEQINNTKYTITSIKKDQKNPSYTIITYTPNDKYNDNDKVTISNSDSAESIDGKDIPIHDVIEAGVIKINKSITVEGTKGDLRCHTNFGNQFSNTINTISDPVIKEVVKVGSDITKNVTDTIFDAAGLPKPSEIIDNIKDFLKQYWWVILIISLVPIILSSILFSITQLT